MIKVIGIVCWLYGLAFALWHEDKSHWSYSSWVVYYGLLLFHWLAILWFLICLIVD